MGRHTQSDMRDFELLRPGPVRVALRSVRRMLTPARHALRHRPPSRLGLSFTELYRRFFPVALPTANRRLRNFSRYPGPGSSEMPSAHWTLTRELEWAGLDVAHRRKARLDDVSRAAGNARLLSLFAFLPMTHSPLWASTHIPAYVFAGLAVAAISTSVRLVAETEIRSLPNHTAPERVYDRMQAGLRALGGPGELPAWVLHICDDSLIPYGRTSADLPSPAPTASTLLGVSDWLSAQLLDRSQLNAARSLSAEFDGTLSDLVRCVKALV